jgi:hypothetical protein
MEFTRFDLTKSHPANQMVIPRCSVFNLIVVEAVTVEFCVAFLIVSVC